MDQLRRRLEDTERAMERLMSQMGSVSDKLTAAKITEVLSQAQAQAKLLKVSVRCVVLTTPRIASNSLYSSPVAVPIDATLLLSKNGRSRFQNLFFFISDT